MNALSTEIFGNVPVKPSFIIPARVDMAVLQELERVLGGRDRVAWMVESSLRPAAEIMQYLQATQSAGFFTAIAASGVEPVVQQINRMLESGRHVVLLCGSDGTGETVADVPASFLRFADSTTLSIVPVGVSMFGAEPVQAMVSTAPYSRLWLHFMAEEPAGNGMAARVQAAWQEATALALAVHAPVAEASLPHALLQSILRYPQAEIIDGVDDSRMSYRRVLIYALILSRRLRHYTSGRRLGIILPPGKLAVIANLACIFAGISPFNVNYSASAEEFSQQRELSGIERYISTEAFIHKQNDFAWPSPRDIIFIDKELLEVGSSHLRFWELMSSWPSKSFVASRVGLPAVDPESEAMLGFATTGGDARPIVYTHKALMAAVVQMQSRLNMQRGEAVLLAQPLSCTESVVPQFLLPLLLGMTLVTYPSPTAGVRLNTMIRRYQVAHLTLQPEHAQGLLNCAEPAQLSSVRRFLLVGGSVPESLVRDSLTRFRLSLCECRYVPEFAAPLTMVTHAAVRAAGSAPAEAPSRFSGNIGTLLPGFSIRFMDLAQKQLQITPGAPGIIRLLGPSLVRSVLSQEDAVGSCYTMPYLGRVNEKAELCILGAVDAFSKVRGELVAHAQAEAALCALLKVDPQDPVRRIALIGIPDPATAGHQLVMLSTVHKKVIPNDTVGLYYGLINLKVSPQWAPKHILAVPSIPLLPDGSVNYEFCRRGIQSVLGAHK